MFMELLFEVVVLAAVLIFLYKNVQPSGRIKACLCFIAVLFAVFAHVISRECKFLTDEITLTALGERNGQAQAEEIWLTGFTVDGEKMEIEKPSLGKWFWIGDTYAWRIESDVRQPSGTTRSVVFNLPVGKTRMVNFTANAWGGKIQISQGQDSLVVDTYSEENRELIIPLQKSSQKKLTLDYICVFLVYAVILLTVVMIEWIITRKISEDMIRASHYLRKNRKKLLYGSIALATFLLMIRFADSASFWADELVQLQCVKGAISDTIRYNLSMIDLSPPLFSICAAVWYRLAPYGEGWLLLICILPTVCSIYLIGFIGDHLGGWVCGIVSAVLMACSTTVWINVAYEFRNYAFVLFFSTLALYMYLRRCESKDQYKWCVGLSLALTGIAMSHYFGMIACAGFFLWDFSSFIRKRLSLRTGILSYLLPGVTSIVWLALIYVSTMSHTTTEAIASWYPIPSIAKVVENLKFLSGNHELAYVLLLLGCVIALTGSFSKKDITVYFRRFLVLMLVGTFMLLFIYGKYINTKSTMWQGRYFIFLIPYVTLLSATAIQQFCEILGEQKGKGSRNKKTICLWITSIFSMHCLSIVPSASAVWQPYRQAADWLYTQANYIYNSDTIILSSTIEAAWNEYYISKQGVRDLLNVLWAYEAAPEEILQYNRVYVQYSHVDIPSSIKQLLDENYIIESDLPDIQVSVYIKP